MSRFVLPSLVGEIIYATVFCRNPSNQTAQAAINNFANELAARFSPIVGCTRSWDAPDPTDFQVRGVYSLHDSITDVLNKDFRKVIIDNMMNLQVSLQVACFTFINSPCLPRWPAPGLIRLCGPDW